MRLRILYSEEICIAVINQSVTEFLLPATTDNSADGSDVDVLAFMWSESSSDIPRIAFGEAASASAADPRKRGGNLSTSTWKAASASSSPGETSESQLKMKTKGRTPFVQTICRKLDDQLQIFLEDARHFAVLKGLFGAVFVVVLYELGRVCLKPRARVRPTLDILI